MKKRIALFVLVAPLLCQAAEPKMPLRSGKYHFQHKFAEHPHMPSITLTAYIKGRHIVLINWSPSSIFPKGILAEGTLTWHAKSGKWIIMNEASDRDAEEVGGCSDGPEEIDLARRIYWTC